MNPVLYSLFLFHVLASGSDLLPKPLRDSFENSQTLKDLWGAVESLGTPSPEVKEQATSLSIERAGIITKMVIISCQNVDCAVDKLEEYRNFLIDLANSGHQIQDKESLYEMRKELFSLAIQQAISFFSRVNDSFALLFDNFNHYWERLKELSDPDFWEQSLKDGHGHRAFKSLCEGALTRGEMLLIVKGEGSLKDFFEEFVLKVLQKQSKYLKVNDSSLLKAQIGGISLPFVVKILKSFAANLSPKDEAMLNYYFTTNTPDTDEMKSMKQAFDKIHEAFLKINAQAVSEEAHKGVSEEAHKQLMEGFAEMDAALGFKLSNRVEQNFIPPNGLPPDVVRDKFAFLLSTPIAEKISTPPETITPEVQNLIDALERLKQRVELLDRPKDWSQQGRLVNELWKEFSALAKEINSTALRKKLDQVSSTISRFLDDSWVELKNVEYDLFRKQHTLLDKLKVIEQQCQSPLIDVQKGEIVTRLEAIRSENEANFTRYQGIYPDKAASKLSIDLQFTNVRNFLKSLKSKLGLPDATPSDPNKPQNTTVTNPNKPQNTPVTDPNNTQNTSGTTPQSTGSPSSSSSTSSSSGSSPSSSGNSPSTTTESSPEKNCASKLSIWSVELLAILLVGMI